MRLPHLAAALAASVLTVAPGRAPAQTVVEYDNGSDSNNNFPFANYVSGVRYQQAYLGSVFGTAPVSIAAVRFFDDEAFASTIRAATYTLRLSTTTRALDGLSATFDQNLGVTTTTVFTGAVPQTSLAEGGFYTFSFLTPFLFDPTAGNLVLDVGLTNVGAPLPVGPGGLFDAVMGSLTTSRVFRNSVSGIVIAEAGGGLRTAFVANSTVPEPGTWALLGTGLLAVGGIAARRKRTTV